MRIAEQLVELAKIWSRANDKSIARLATIVVNRGHFFDSDIDTMSRAGIQTFEKFLRFFRDGGNWEGGVIPAAAVDLLDNFENIATEAAASTGHLPETSPADDALAGFDAGADFDAGPGAAAAQDEAA